MMKLLISHVNNNVVKRIDSTARYYLLFIYFQFLRTSAPLIDRQFISL